MTSELPAVCPLSRVLLLSGDVQLVMVSGWWLVFRADAQLKHCRCLSINCPHNWSHVHCQQQPLHSGYKSGGGKIILRKILTVIFSKTDCTVPCYYFLVPWLKCLLLFIKIFDQMPRLCPSVQCGQEPVLTKSRLIKWSSALSGTKLGPS